MKLPIRKEYFDLIKAGVKTVEYRDAHITFICEETGEMLMKRVVDVAMVERHSDLFPDVLKDDWVIQFKLQKQGEIDMKAIKFVEKKIEGEFEIIKNHVINIDANKDIIEFVAVEYLNCDCSDPDDDWLNKGVMYDEDGAVAYIKIGKFLDAVDKKVEDGNDELEPDDYKEIMKLKDFRDYEIWLKS